MRSLFKIFDLALDPPLHHGVEPAKYRHGKPQQQRGGNRDGK
jgi:hypothetical protein